MNSIKQFSPAVFVTISVIWTYKVLRTSMHQMQNVERLEWELSKVKKELDAFDEMGGPEGLLEHQIYWEYQEREEKIARSVERYNDWSKKSYWQRFFSIPPNRLLNMY